jgi:hypothetical protein
MTMELPNSIKLEIDAARAAIARIRGLNLERTSIDELKEDLNPVFCGYIQTTPRFPPGLELFRAVQLLNKPVHVSGLLYPPPETAPLNRANREGSSVLYCCAARKPTFFELFPRVENIIVGATLVFSKWVTTASLLVNHVGYTSQVFEKLGSGRREASWGDRPVKDYGEENSEISTFLADTFTRRIPDDERYRHKLSVAIAEKLFSDDMFDALLYPSIAASANCDNLAIKPRYADANLRFLRAEFVRIEAVRGSAVDTALLDSAVAVDDDGRIQWRGHGNQWVLRKKGDELTMTAENGRWVGRDADGRIVEPE